MNSGRLFSTAVILTLIGLGLFTALSQGQRITTIQLDGVQYFVSRLNPYSPQLNYFLAYQYCRSLGLQLVSFESREKADGITNYLLNAGHTTHDYWTSGNSLGTDMFLWMSSGLPFNATFDYMRSLPGEDTPVDPVVGRSASGSQSNRCVALKAPTLDWDADDCLGIKDFICEQTRCYYFNYGSIPVSSAQGTKRPHRPVTTTQLPPSGVTNPPFEANLRGENEVRARTIGNLTMPVVPASPPSTAYTEVPTTVDITTAGLPIDAQ